ncbi:hypothetical protein QUF75_20720 [Desulfococcaceae bacterium HSG7]|nr:hypothetical protein [Desulfococcaceae bacterium HSG7]
MSTPETTINNLEKMANNAYKGGLYLKATQLFHQAGELAKEQQDERQRISCLFWEGHCFYLADKKDDALPLLMEAAACRSPEANPADIYSAATDAIEISLDRNPTSFCRKIIEQTRGWLKSNHKEDWRHQLDLLAGDLEYQRGEFDTAYSYFVHAYDVWCQGKYGTRYTESTHLKWLCITAFLRRNVSNQQRWTEVLESCSKTYEIDKITAQLARLLLFRARRSEDSEFSAAADIAISMLDHLEMIDGTNEEYRVSALRVLILANRYLEVKRVKEQYLLEEEGFDGLLFLGDELLCRAREVLGMEVRDDEYDVKFPDPIPPFPDVRTGLQYLEKAAAFYVQAMDEAEDEDERLETDYYTRTLKGRLLRARRMRDAVKKHR